MDVKTAKTFIERSELITVKNFAKDTGDFTSLSEVDMQVIALGVGMARLKKEQHMIRKEPMDLTEFRPTNFDTDYKRKFDEAASSEEEDSDSSDDGKPRKGAAVDSDDEWNAVGNDR